MNKARATTYGLLLLCFVIMILVYANAGALGRLESSDSILSWSYPSSGFKIALWNQWRFPSDYCMIIIGDHNFASPFSFEATKGLILASLAGGIALIFAVITVLRRQKKTRLNLEVQSKQRIEQKPSQPLTGP